METPDAQQQIPPAGGRTEQPPVYSAVFTGVCLCLALVTYSAIAPGWPLGVCLLAVFAVLIISFIITIIAQWIFEYMAIGKLHPTGGNITIDANMTAVKGQPTNHGEIGGAERDYYNEALRKMVMRARNAGVNVKNPPNRAN